MQRAHHTRIIGTVIKVLKHLYESTEADNYNTLDFGLWTLDNPKTTRWNWYPAIQLLSGGGKEAIAKALLIEEKEDGKSRSSSLAPLSLSSYE
jgi:hypothetical protein